MTNAPKLLTNAKMKMSKIDFMELLVDVTYTDLSKNQS